MVQIQQQRKHFDSQWDRGIAMLEDRLDALRYHRNRLEKETSKTEVPFIWDKLNFDEGILQMQPDESTPTKKQA
jgi:hypothetical protein